eukprot:1992697-Amphidinium_carterae.1
MRDRHWEKVSELISHEVTPDMEEFTLEQLLAMGVQPFSKQIAEIGERSGKEHHIEVSLASMKAAWKSVFFDCSEPYRSTGSYILKGADEVIQLSDEQIITVQAMLLSPFKKPFEEEIDEWSQKMSYVSDCIEAWVKVQRDWMYLQPIFDSPDILQQLPTEGKKFRFVDNKWRQVMTGVHSSPAALPACSQEGLLDLWQNAYHDLEMVQKGLDDYLETKRGAFARFYFLSNDELLEIVSQTKDPLRVQPFLPKVFEAMKKLTFTDAAQATEMHSKEGELIPFPQGVDTSGRNVEAWMTDVELQMLAAVRAVLEQGIELYLDVPRAEW